MCDYLSANGHKSARLVEEIVDTLKQYDGFNGEVWKYVSEKLGYALKEKAVTPSADDKYTKELEHRLNMIDDDAAKLRTFIIDKGISSYFRDAKDELFGFVYLDNIDVACDLNDDECLSWKRYKKIID
jgi:hypothetical protein